eukprot:TRINITY_DN6197_c0_g1_i2.p5 TRINITY_DN6197_c0_g1~~TRINITY_DN6197_c0_g1_i2.p5  ORF type:complete len:100 (+),score=0.02 TRINITY_DN6197_c0_g1_i2:409-708(+)
MALRNQNFKNFLKLLFQFISKKQQKFHFKCYGSTSIHFFISWYFRNKCGALSLLCSVWLIQTKFGQLRGEITSACFFDEEKDFSVNQQESAPEEAQGTE